MYIYMYINSLCKVLRTTRTSRPESGCGCLIRAVSARHRYVMTPPWGGGEELLSMTLVRFVLPVYLFEVKSKGETPHAFSCRGSLNQKGKSNIHFQAMLLEEFEL